MGDKKSISELAITLILARGISFFITVFIPLVLVRFLNQSEFGTYKQSMLLLSTAITLVPWGMAQSLYYFLPKDSENRRGYFINTILFLFIVGLIALLGFAFSGPFLGNIFHSKELAQSAPMIGIYVFFMIITSYSEIVLTAENRVKEAAWVILFYEIGKAITLIAGAWLTRSYQGIMICLAISAMLRFVLTSFYFREELKTFKNSFNTKLMSVQWHYAMPFGMMSLFTFFQDYFHQYYISFYFTPAQFAIYAVGCLDLPLIDLFYSSIGNIVMVKMAEYLKEDNRKMAQEVWHEAIAKLAVIFFPLTVYMIIISRHFILALFTEKYLESVPIFMIYLISIPSAILLADPVLRVFEETRYMLLISILRIPLTLIIVTSLLSLLGIIGGAISTVVILLIVRIAMLLRVKKILATSFEDLLPWRALANIFLVSLVAGVMILPMTWLAISSKLILIISASVYGLIYLMAGIKVDIFPIEEREWIRQFFTKFNYLKVESNE